MRAPIAILLAAGTVLALSACSPSTTVQSFDGCTPSIAPGDASNSVSVETEFGEAVTAEFEAPLVSSDPQVTFLEGPSEPANEYDYVDAYLTVYLGKTGELVQSSHQNETVGGEAQQIRLQVGGDGPVGEVLECSGPGARIVYTTTIGDVFGEGFTAQRPDTKPQDSAVLVLDVTKVWPGSATGRPQPQVDGMPSVARAENGQPGLTFPSSAAPEDLTIATILKGDGETVAAGDNVVLQYTGVIWETQTVFDSSWESGQPATFPLVEGSLIDGFYQAVVGAEVGSQILVSIPEEYGYSDPATRPGAIPAGANLVFVIDVLGIE
ncbi:FKBP-type peptidyl-prolyl cis-trans isomerase [Humidisolicoccus flavus]|uniref:FKBP-type peptidyl-prolyl cis-trans isomerase n=1 Tax=Humidisolicoccus flavus TaxID=3111414 RepID=UPI0032518CB2